MKIKWTHFILCALFSLFTSGISQASDFSNLKQFCPDKTPRILPLVTQDSVAIQEKLGLNLSYRLDVKNGDEATDFINTITISGVASPKLFSLPLGMVSNSLAIFTVDQRVYRSYGYRIFWNPVMAGYTGNQTRILSTGPASDADLAPGDSLSQYSDFNLSSAIPVGWTPIQFGMRRSVDEAKGIDNIRAAIAKEIKSKGGNDESSWHDYSDVFNNLCGPSFGDVPNLYVYSAIKLPVNWADNVAREPSYTVDDAGRLLIDLPPELIGNQDIELNWIVLESNLKDKIETQLNDRQAVIYLKSIAKNVSCRTGALVLSLELAGEVYGRIKIDRSIVPEMAGPRFCLDEPQVGPT